MNVLLSRLSLVIGLVLGGSLAQAQPAGFVRRQGTGLMLDGKPYRFIGVNYWYEGLLATQGEAGKARFKKELDFLKKQGVTNLRVMVGGEGLNNGYKYRMQQPLQTEPGKFDESIAVGLDYLLAELGAQHHKAMIVSSYQKGIRDFDVNKAWAATKHDLTTPGQAGPCGGYVGNRQLGPYLQYGYVPDEDGASSNTLEDAYDDYVAGQFAQALGKTDDQAYFAKRALSYKKSVRPADRLHAPPQARWQLGNAG